MSAIFCKHKHNKDKCDDLLWNRIHKTGHVYENKNRKLLDPCQHEYNLIKRGIYLGNSFFKESYNNAKKNRINQERSKLFGHLICSSSNKNLFA
jgi:hypothetical protein